MTEKKVYPFTRDEIITSEPTETKTFTYANSGWKDQLIQVNDDELTYDANGNVLTFGNRTFTWNTGRNLASITDGDNTYSYTYDEYGIRTSKTVNGVTTYYNTKDGVILSQSDGTNTMYFQYDSNGVPIGFIYNGTQYFYLTNQMSDVIGITKSDGNLICEYVYDEWGKVLYASTYDYETHPAEYTAANANPLRYRGYYYDSETGYYYLQSRYYDPSICRFINADVPEIAQMSKDMSLETNLFAYCDNDPVDYDDYYGSYNRQKAVDYAKRWAYLRNPKYRPYSQDCANFVSQCLAAGGIKTNNKWHNERHIVVGIFNKGKSLYDVTSTWSTVRGIMSYFVNYKKYCTQTAASYFSNRNENANKIIKNFISFAENIQVGDIMLMDTHLDGKEAYNHATIITKITNNEIYYTAHSRNRLNAKLSKKISDKSIESIYVISLKNSAV